MVFVDHLGQFKWCWYIILDQQQTSSYIPKISLTTLKTRKIEFHFMSVGFSSHLTEYLSWSPPLSQELQCGPGDGQSDGETLWFRPHIHHGEDHLCLFPSSAGRTAVPPQPQGGGSHAQVQTPGQVSGKWLSMYLLYLREVYLCHCNRGIFTVPVHFPSSVIQSVWAEAWHHPFKPKGRAFVRFYVFMLLVALRLKF